MSQASFRRLLRGDAALAPRLLMALLRQDETRRPGRKRKAPKPMAGLRPHRADSPAARLLAEGGVDDYRVPLTTSQADSYRQVYAQIQTLGAAAISTAQLASHMSMEARCWSTRTSRPPRSTRCSPRPASTRTTTASSRSTRFVRKDVSQKDLAS